MVKQRIELWTGREDFKRKVRAVQYDSVRTLECAVMDAALPEGAKKKRDCCRGRKGRSDKREDSRGRR